MTEPFLPEHRAAFRQLHALKILSRTHAAGRILLIFMLSMLLFMMLVPWVQTAPGQGFITALHPEDRAQQISAMVPGRIQQWHVQEGSVVSQGDPIVEILDNDDQLIQRLMAERNALQQNIELDRIAA